MRGAGPRKRHSEQCAIRAWQEGASRVRLPKEPTGDQILARCVEERLDDLGDTVRRPIDVVELKSAAMANRREAQRGFAPRYVLLSQFTYPGERLVLFPLLDHFCRVTNGLDTRSRLRCASSQTWLSTYEPR